MPNVRNRKGRKRKQGQRHGNGRLVYKAPDDRLAASLMPHRRGLPEAYRLSEQAETELGRLWIRGIIADVQRIAGEHYAKVANLYFATACGPRRLVDGRRSTGCNPETCHMNGGCICLRRKREFTDIHEALVRCGGRIESVVTDVAIFDKEPGDLEPLRLGLSALAVYLRLSQR